MTHRNAKTEHDISHPRDVRAGPGDAGATDRPTHLPEHSEDRREGRSATRLLLWLVIFGVIVVLLLDSLSVI